MGGFGQKMKIYSDFTRGIKDGLPIAFGYVSVAFAYGVLAVSGGLPIWMPILISMTNLTGTGQFVGTQLLMAGAALAEIALAVFIINIRYILMSISLSQKLPVSINLPKRMIIAFGNTDEIYAVAITKDKLSFKYMLGIIASPYCGWVVGTILGTLFGGVIPGSITAAMGITLYAMFIAIIFPPAKNSPVVFFIILAAGVLSCVFKCTPFLNTLSSGFTLIICGILVASVFAVIFPVGEKKKPLPKLMGRQ